MRTNQRGSTRTKSKSSRFSGSPSPKQGQRQRQRDEYQDFPRERTRTRDRDRDQNGEKRSAKPNSFRERPRIQRGPWGESAYLPSSLLTKGGRRLPEVKPNRAKRTNRAPIEATQAAQAVEVETDGKERLQKVLARCGVASRRNAELLILEGAVTVNGRPITELGTKVDAANDKIKVNGSLIYTQVEPIYLALYKPKGMISALSDPEGRRHIGHIVSSIRERVITIGRLDYNSEGLILLTNDGDLADKITKAHTLPRIYMVKIKGHPTEKELDFLKRGIFSADGVVRFASYGVEQTLKSKSWLKLEVVDGSKLDLRNLLNHRGLLVDRIIRTGIGHMSAQGLKPGEYRFTKRADFEKLLSFVNKN